MSIELSLSDTSESAEQATLTVESPINWLRIQLVTAFAHVKT